MYPVILRIGPLALYSYGLMLAAAFIVAIIVALPESKRRGVDIQTIIDIALISAVFGIAGARLWYVAFEWRQFVYNPFEIVKIQNGGLAVQGGLLLGIAANYVYCKVKRLKFWELADILAPSIIIGQAIGRIGCFLNGCCYGVPTKSVLGVIFPPDSPAAVKFGLTAVHPTELYQMFANLVVFTILLGLRKKSEKMVNGSLFLLYIALYSIGRFVVEIFRSDGYLVLGNLSNAQAVSVLAVLVSLTSLIIINRSPLTNNQ